MFFSFPSLMSRNFRAALLFSILLFFFLYLDVPLYWQSCMCVVGRGKPRLDKSHWREEEVTQICRERSPWCSEVPAALPSEQAVMASAKPRPQRSKSPPPSDLVFWHHAEPTGAADPEPAFPSHWCSEGTLQTSCSGREQASFGKCAAQGTA